MNFYLLLIIAVLLFPTQSNADFIVDPADERIVYETGTGEKEGYIDSEWTIKKLEDRIIQETLDLAYFTNKVNDREASLVILRKKLADIIAAGAITEEEYEAENAAPIEIPAVVNENINWQSFDVNNNINWSDAGGLGK